MLLVISGLLNICTKYIFIAFRSSSYKVVLMGARSTATKPAAASKRHPKIMISDGAETTAAYRNYFELQIVTSQLTLNNELRRRKQQFCVLRCQTSSEPSSYVIENPRLCLKSVFKNSFSKLFFDVYNRSMSQFKNTLNLFSSF